MGVREIFEVVYSPVKAFKKIIEKPDFKGVLLILVLVIFSMAVVQYVAASKFFVETRTPDDDDWTESLTNQHNWTSNDSPSLDGTDYKMGNADGNHSIKSLILNDTSIWLKITDIEPLDCSEDTGYEELFFWIKWIHENGSSPSSGATLRLFSGGESSYFELNLTSLASSDEWKNVTLKIGPDQGWISLNSPDWQSVTGLEFKLAWPAPANLTMKIDGLYFRKYVSLLESGVFSGAIIPILIQVAVLPFFMNWVLWAGILLLVAKLFREEAGPWTTFFTIIGHVFIVTVIYTIASAAPLSTLPELNLPLETDDTNVLIYEMWSPYLAYQVWLYLPLVGEVWIAGLCTIVIRLLRGVTWGKAASISLVAFTIRFVLKLFLGI